MLFEYPAGISKVLTAKKILHSEINHFWASLRSVIKASASLPLLCWKVCTIAILLNALISIKDYARNCWRKFIHCLAFMRHKLIWFRSRRRSKLSACWCVLKYFKLKEIFSNRVGKKSCPLKPFFRCFKNHSMDVV